MGSQSRRTRKGDRSRKDPHHKVMEAQEIARVEEKRRKAREYKQQSQARVCASLLEASSISPTGETSDLHLPMVPLVAPIVHSPPLHSPSSLPVSLIPFPCPLSPIGTHRMASSTLVADEGTAANMGFLGGASYLGHVPTQGAAFSLSSSHAMDKQTPPTIGLARHVHMGSSYLEYTPMISSHSTYVSSPLSPVDDHTPGFLEHGHMVTSPTQHQLSPGYARQATSSFDGVDHSPLASHGRGVPLSGHYPPPIPQEVGGGDSSPPIQVIPDASPSSVAHRTLRSLTRSGVIYRARRIAEHFFADIDIPSCTQVLDALF